MPELSGNGVVRLERDVRRRYASNARPGWRLTPDPSRIPPRLVAATPKGDGDSRTRSPAVAESPGRRTRRRLQRPTCSRFLLRCETPLSCRPDRTETGTLPLDRQCERTQWRYRYTLYGAWKPASAANTTGPALTCEAMADTDTLRSAMNLHTQLTAVAGGSSLLRLERVVRSRPLTLDSCPSLKDDKGLGCGRG